MGFDIYGIRQRSEKGRHFGISAFWWAGLGSYVLDVCSDLFKEGETEDWGVNNGTRVSGRTAKAIAARLHELLGSGAVKRFERQYRKEQRENPTVPCQCTGTGRAKGGTTVSGTLSVGVHHTGGSPCHGALPWALDQTTEGPNGVFCFSGGGGRKSVAGSRWRLRRRV